MAERLKDKILDKEKMVDIIAGPGIIHYQKIHYRDIFVRIFRWLRKLKPILSSDSYRDLPRLLQEIKSGQAAGKFSASFKQQLTIMMLLYV